MLKQPVGQKRLTNIALIKYRINKKTFEIACYRNMAIDYRNGIETNVDEVVQAQTVYVNAVQGEQASKEELEKYFPKMKNQEIIKTILEKGELQITDKERETQSDLMFKDVANIIAEKCCHPDSKRPFSVDSIKAAMKSVHFAVKLDQPAKKQASECIKKLQEMFYIARAEMKIKITIPSKLKENLSKEFEFLKVNPKESQDTKENMTYICLIEPSLYRNMDDLIKKKLEAGSVEILEQYVMNRETTDLENAGFVNLQPRENVSNKKSNEEDNSDDEKSSKSKKKSSKAKKGNEKKGKDEEVKHEEPIPVSSDKITEKSDEEKKISVENEPKEEVAEKKFKCTTCKDAAFETNVLFKSHFKTDWHNANLKRKGEKKPPLSEPEYQDQLLDAELVSNLKKK